MKQSNRRPLVILVILVVLALIKIGVLVKQHHSSPDYVTVTFGDGPHATVQHFSTAREATLQKLVIQDDQQMMEKEKIREAQERAQGH